MGYVAPVVATVMKRATGVRHIYLIFALLFSAFCTVFTDHSGTKEGPGRTVKQHLFTHKLGSDVENPCTNSIDSSVRGGGKTVPPYPNGVRHM